MKHIFTKSFNKISKNDVDIAGGKGASLGEMMINGIPVPSGFVILSSTFDKFLEITNISIEINNIFQKVKYSEDSAIENASKIIQDLILKTKISDEIAKEIKSEFKKLNTKYVAVRSSATAEDSVSDAWAGQLDSFLNTTKDNLLENVKKCWASLFTPRAIFYRFEKNLNDKKISVAVVIQKMIDSDVSGVAFSVHPVTEDRNQIIIEAGYGLGEAIVSGQITPDSYVISKYNLKILDKNISIQKKGIYRSENNNGSDWKNIVKAKISKQCLSDNQIIELSELIIKIENHYNFPCDIEWAMKDGVFYIVQSRPITTLEDNTENKTTKKIYSKLVHIDLPLSLVELHYEQESTSSVPWAEEKFTIKPYIIYERKNNLTYLFYDVKGLDWQINTAGQFGREKFAINKIKKGYDKIKDIIEKEKILNREEILDFLKNLRTLWPWLNYMWWAIEYKDKNKEFVDDLMKIRKYTEYFTPGMISVFKKSLKKIYPKLKNYTSVISLKELENNKIPDIKILKERLKGYAYTDNKLFDSIEDIFQNYDIKIIEEKNNKKGLSGQIAYPGKVKGFVRIIQKREDLNEFRKGEIIVASTTTPDYLFAMKKSSAIISEHGGMICHAAITSRELKIPCVVGVKNITTILNNGDEIEVDADNGVINILNKNINNKREVDFNFLNKLEFIYEVDGVFSFLLMDIIVNNFMSDVDLACIIKNNKFRFFVDKESLENIFLAKVVPMFSTKIKMKILRNKFVHLEEGINNSFINIKKNKNNIDSFVDFFSAIEKFIKNYNLIDVSLSAKNEEYLKNKGKLIYSNYLKIGELRNELRLTVNNLIISSNSIFSKIIKEFADKLNISNKDILFYKKKEIIDFNIGLNPSKKIIEKRKVFSSIIRNSNVVYYYDIAIPSQIRSLYNYKKNLLTNHNKVKGSVVFGNDVVSGEVIVFPNINIDKVNLQVKKILRLLSEKGKKSDYILITNISVPEMATLFNKFKAIIVDFGGLNSHAAIIARDFKTPCIVEAKIASKVFKDGDNIGVNFKNGIIKKI